MLWNALSDLVLIKLQVPHEGDQNTGWNVQKEVRLFTPFILSCVRSTGSSKASSLHSAIQYFFFEIPVSSRFLKVIQ